ncbi:hypothetical protein [Ammoniphilus resinae]|uniref:Protein kinase domain-containing protein n=1 Tax=Ammoniphilus resinae TaxID=861532 RepID=A0ABS4GTW7_9BACL|nr:hypothetical protein [Ammoniphilus resinae]MBP1933698.1 hypothetical protein [Ammoniphilus resinae]
MEPSIQEWIDTLNQHGEAEKAHRANQAKKKLNLPYKILGVGNNRIVYEWNEKYILKVAISKKGIRQISNETRLFTCATDELRKYLAPVTESGPGWLLMKKMVTPIPTTKKSLREVLRIILTFEQANICPKDILGKNEPKWSNFALDQEGELVIIDYGGFYPTADKSLSPESTAESLFHDESKDAGPPAK